jgi:variant SH3 domain-containing protein
MTSLFRHAVAIAAWRPMYPDPIDVRAGEAVTVGGTDPEWPGWVWCTDPRGKSGWTPIGILRPSPRAGTAVVSSDFTARELRVEPGEPLVLLQLESGWYRARGAAGEGWLPASHVEPND